MVALADNPVAQRGCAALEVKLVCGESAVTSAFATSPLKLLAPRSRGQSVWAYTSSFGGGLVAGDQTRLNLSIGEGARCFIGTQASTKIYRNPALLPSGHTTSARLASRSLLVFAPDPVQAFAGSTYTQRQEFHLAADASLIFLDWFTSGRAARGERWAFQRFHSRNDFFVGDQRVLADAILLDASQAGLDSPHRVGRFNCFALLVLLGPLLRESAARLLADIANQSVPRRGPLVCSASPLGGGVLLRVAGEQVETVGRELHRHLAGVSDLLGDDPWARKW